MKGKDHNVICFGEILWDNLPAGRKPGGAPMNVAYHLKKLGINSKLISRVGDDKNGEELVAFIKAKGLSIDFCQKDADHVTSTVEVMIGDDQEVRYDIVAPVAWDFIALENGLIDLVFDSDAFVFGSLATRNVTSYETLLALLEKASCKVFDVNLRAPHFDVKRIGELLSKTDLLKLNIHELYLISEWFSTTCRTESDRISVLQNFFGIPEIVLTKGGSGACYYTKSAQCNYPAFKVEVNDTVGSGDSFLAAFLSKKLNGEGIEGTLNYASALGAFITTHSGACPEYKKYDLERFIWKNELNSASHFIK